MSKIRDITGKRFGSLVALERVGSDKRGHSLWLFECDCGNTVINQSNKVLTGNTSTCGCRNGHGMRYARIYRTWINMKARCSNKNEPRFKWYGAKGVRVCKEWGSEFKVFYEWAMKNGYADNLTIDRIDSGGNYHPNNCRWVTNVENVKNKVITKETREKISKVRKVHHARLKK